MIQVTEHSASEIHYDNMLSKVSAIAGILGDGWKIEQNDALAVGKHNATRIKLQSTLSGHGIMFAWDTFGEKYKLRIFGTYDYGSPEFDIDFPSDKARADIKVADSKSAQQIVAEMRRRFFPAYDEATSEITRRVNRYVNDKQVRMDAAARLAAIAGGAIHGNIQKTGFTANYPEFGIRAEVRINHGSTGMDLNVSNVSEYEMAELLTLIRKFNDTRS